MNEHRTSVAIVENLARISGWQPGQPLELLPVLRIQYPGGVRQDVHSVCLQYVDRDWSIRITEELPDRQWLQVRKVDLLPLVDDGDGYDYSDYSAAEFPCEVIEALLKCTDQLHSARLLGIFVPATMAFLERFETRIADVTDSAEFVEQNKRNFYLGCAQHLAEYLAADISLSEKAIKLLKSRPGFDINGESELSLWETLVTERERNSLLWETWRSDLHSAIADAFWQLPHPQQLALWMSHKDTSDMLQELVEGNDQPADVMDMKLYEISLIFDDVEREIVWALDEAVVADPNGLREAL